MSQARLRMIIFIAWSAFLAVSLVATLAAPQLRGDGSLVDAEMPFEAILGLYLPAIGCLAGIWFPTEEERRVGASRRVPRDRAIASLVLTYGYLALSFLFVFHAVYVWDYSVGGGPIPKGGTFAERVAHMIGIAAALSGPALLPISFLTRTPPGEPASKNVSEARLTRGRS
jgi:hypothetical protein